MVLGAVVPFVGWVGCFFDNVKDKGMEVEDNVSRLNAVGDLGAVGRSYSFTEPKYFVDDEVWFKDNKGLEMEGKIVNVETHWSNKNEAYHIYTLYKEGRKRLMHIGERNIIYKYDF